MQIIEPALVLMYFLIAVDPLIFAYNLPLDLIVVAATTLLGMIQTLRQILEAFSYSLHASQQLAVFHIVALEFSLIAPSHLQRAYGRIFAEVIAWCIIGICVLCGSCIRMCCCCQLLCG